ncbi:MAG: DNA oxidative demethylase AlkB [Granulosicoccus sp.]|nr:DNA oxidative demethylase AlkB [Granulosicoccus sp.]
MFLLRGFADSRQLQPELGRVLDTAPPRSMQTPRGFQMSVLLSNCGRVGWVSDRRGYRYSPTDPNNGLAWPAMPATFRSLATRAALTAGFDSFEPDVCLINRYVPDTQMGLHQDRDEASFDHPIVSVSLGIDARFYFTGLERKGKSTSIDLSDGDVMVFGGPARLYYHGVRKIKPSIHPLFGSVRWNLTFRQAA